MMRGPPSAFLGGLGRERLCIWQVHERQNPSHDIEPMK